MRILVHGTDALGALLAAELALADHDVTVLAPLDRAERLRADGIRLRDADTGATETVSVRVADRLSPDESFDLVIATGEAARLEEALPPAPWGRDVELLMLPRDVERAAVILGESDISIKDLEAHYEGDVVVYRVPAAVRRQPVGSPGNPPEAWAPAPPVPEEIAQDLGAEVREFEARARAARERAAAESRQRVSEHGWLPTHPPEEEFAQPPEIELPPVRPPSTAAVKRAQRAEATAPPREERYVKVPPRQRPEELPSEGTLITREGEGLLPEMPEAAEGDTPWPEPLPAGYGVGTVVTEHVRHTRHRPNWNALALAGLIAWVVWRIVRTARRTA